VAGYVRWSRFAFNVVAWIFAGCCAIQVYLAGLGVFAGSGNFTTHSGFGYLVGLLTLVLIVLAALARLPRRVIGASVLLLVLFALQSVFIALWKSNPPNGALAALHPLNGFLIFLVAVAVAWTTRGYLRPTRDADGAAG
jgi:hypothetical protein